MIKCFFPAAEVFLPESRERVKRADDILFALLLLIPSLPLMALISLCIKAEDGGAGLLQAGKSNSVREVFFYAEVPQHGPGSGKGRAAAGGET